MTVTFSDNHIIVGEKKVEFEVPVYEVKRSDDTIYVLLHKDKYKKDDPNKERNIIALDLNGDVRWRIQNPPSFYTFYGKRVLCSYIGIDPDSGDENRRVVAYDGYGSCWKVDPKTGRVSDPIVSR